jgi:hypothetical protein
MGARADTNRRRRCVMGGSKGEAPIVALWKAITRPGLFLGTTTGLAMGAPPATTQALDLPVGCADESSSSSACGIVRVKHRRVPLQVPRWRP